MVEWAENKDDDTTGRCYSATFPTVGDKKLDQWKLQFSLMEYYL